MPVITLTLLIGSYEHSSWDYLLQVEAVMATVATVEDYDGPDVSEVDSNPLGVYYVHVGTVKSLGTIKGTYMQL